MSSNGSRTGVTTEITVGLVTPDNGLLPLMASLAYSVGDPYAVTMAFEVGTDEPVEWALARELLAAALDAVEGIGDFQAWPSEPGGVKILHMSMTSPFGQAQFEASAEDISAFLDRTFELVPAGQEAAHLNLDAELAALFSQA
jgi:Streptomyces sporulation and cell division protein, SsgA